jgi:hypothetical protein
MVAQRKGGKLGSAHLPQATVFPPPSTMRIRVGSASSGAEEKYRSARVQSGRRRSSRSQGKSMPFCRKKERRDEAFAENLLNREIRQEASSPSQGRSRPFSETLQSGGKTFA